MMRTPIGTGGIHRSGQKSQRFSTKHSKKGASIGFDVPFSVSFFCAASECCPQNAL